MTATEKPNEGLLSYLSQVVLGAAVGQVLRTRGINPVEAESHTTEVESVMETLDSLGIDPAHIADLMLTSLRALYDQPKNRSTVTEALAHLLWQTLGDPESGNPPGIYLKAADVMRNFYLCLLNPDFTTQQ